MCKLLYNGHRRLGHTCTVLIEILHDCFSFWCEIKLKFDHDLLAVTLIDLRYNIELDLA